MTPIIQANSHGSSETEEITGSWQQEGMVNDERGDKL